MKTRVTIGSHRGRKTRDAALTTTISTSIEEAARLVIDMEVILAIGKVIVTTLRGAAAAVVSHERKFRRMRSMGRRAVGLVGDRLLMMTQMLNLQTSTTTQTMVVVIQSSSTKTTKIRMQKIHFLWMMVKRVRRLT